MGQDRRKQHGKGRPPDRERRSQYRSQAKKLVRDAGLPENVALQVAKGETTLSQAIADLARADQIRMLMRKHELSKGVASQVALGQMNLDEYLLKRRLQAYMGANRERSLLDTVVADESDVWLCLHGQRQTLGRVLEIGRYELEFESADGRESIHKLQLKLVAMGADAEQAKADLGLSEEAATTEPITAPQDRYHLSDRRIMTFMEEGEKVCLQTLEGDLLRGHIEWFSRWEVGLRTRESNTLIVAFRHAIAHLDRG